MHPGIVTISDSKRGCGWRKIGGLYLTSDKLHVRGCGKLPISLAHLNRCPHCGEELPGDYGVKVSRGARMIAQPEVLFGRAGCDRGDCQTCPLSNAFECGPALLIWIGEGYYATPADYNREVDRQGISRRISQIPKEFTVGETWVLLAHAKAIIKQVQKTQDEKTGQGFMFGKPEVEYEPGIFSMFCPTRIEQPVTGTESDEFIDRLIKRGITPVLIERVGDDGASNDDGEEDDSVLL